MPDSTTTTSCPSARGSITSARCSPSTRWRLPPSLRARLPKPPLASHESIHHYGTKNWRCSSVYWFATRTRVATRSSIDTWLMFDASVGCWRAIGTSTAHSSRMRHRCCPRARLQSLPVLKCTVPTQSLARLPACSLAVLDADRTSPRSRVLGWRTSRPRTLNGCRSFTQFVLGVVQQAHDLLEELQPVFLKAAKYATPSRGIHRSTFAWIGWHSRLLV